MVQKSKTASAREGELTIGSVASVSRWWGHCRHLPAVCGAGRHHQPERRLPLGPVDQLRRPRRGGPGRRRLHHGRRHLCLQPEKIRAPAPARQALGLRGLSDLHRRALLRSGPALAHLAPHDHVEPPLRALRGVLVRHALHHGPGHRHLHLGPGALAKSTSGWHFSAASTCSSSWPGLCSPRCTSPPWEPCSCSCPKRCLPSGRHPAIGILFYRQRHYRRHGHGHPGESLQRPGLRQKARNGSHLPAWPRAWGSPW